MTVLASLAAGMSLRHGRDDAVAIAPSEATGGTDDAVLIARVALGNESAFRMLAGRHMPRMIALADRLLGNAAEAEDVAQEALVRIWRHAGRFDPRRARLSTWIYRIVYNLCLDRLRRPRAQPIEEAAEIPDPAPDTLSTLTDLGDRKRLRAALARLPERQRTAVVLFYYQELPGQEAADVLGLSLRAYWSLLHRARQALQQDFGNP